MVKEEWPNKKEGLAPVKFGGPANFTELEQPRDITVTFSPAEPNMRDLAAQYGKNSMPAKLLSVGLDQQENKIGWAVIEDQYGMAYYDVKETPDGWVQYFKKRTSQE